MKFRENFPAFFLLFLVSSASCIADARKDPRVYWKSRMNGEPMPKAISDLLNHTPAASSVSTNSDRFGRRFETKPNIIIYHSHHIHSEKPGPSSVDDSAMHVKNRQKGPDREH